MSTDHSNHHNHDENCECGCHDEHHHHPDISHEHHPISVKTHETSLVGSFQFDIDTSIEEAETIIDDLLKQVAREVIALGGIIGHIKAFIRSEGNSCMISITDDQSDKHYSTAVKCHVEGVSIVFCILPDQLEQILKSAFEKYIV